MDRYVAVRPAHSLGTEACFNGTLTKMVLFTKLEPNDHAFLELK